MTTPLIVPPQERESQRLSPCALPSRSDRPASWWGPFLLRLHFYAGILVGPFILVAAVSGALYALTPAIEQVVYRHELHVPTTQTRLTLAEQTAIAQHYLGHDVLPSAVRPAPEPGDTTRIMFSTQEASESQAVFIDPGTGEVRGDLTVYGTSGALPLRTWVDRLHRDLYLGDGGLLYSELAASWLWIVALAGLGLWVGRIRKSRTKMDFIRPGRNRVGYRRLFSWHTSIGVWVLIGALFLSATGLTWSHYAGGRIGDLRAALHWSTPALDAKLSTGSRGHLPPQRVPLEQFDSVLTTAQHVNINTGRVEIRPPRQPDAAWVVQEIQRSYPTEVDEVAIDGDTLRVVDRNDFAHFPLAAKLTRWGIDAHMGSLFGLPHQIFLCVLASAIAVAVVLGYLMWWRRRPVCTPRQLAGSVPQRGAVRGAPWWGIGAVMVGALLVGWYLPLVGYTLAGFVVIDVVVGWWSDRFRAGDR